jgi:oligopeptide/dipeptide ABC transporter ATP-binding protein
VPEPKAQRERHKLAGDAPTPAAPPAGCRFHTRCPIAIEQCRGERPQLVEITPGHRVACIRAE